MEAVEADAQRPNRDAEGFFRLLFNADVVAEKRVPCGVGHEPMNSCFSDHDPPSAKSVRGDGWKRRFQPGLVRKPDLVVIVGGAILKVPGLRKHRDTQSDYRNNANCFHLPS